MVAVTATRKKLQPENSIGHVHRTCPVCVCPELDYEFIVDNYPVCACRYCALMFLNPQPDRPSDSGVLRDLSDTAIYDIHSANAAGRLDQLASYGGVGTGKLMLVGGDDVMERVACMRGDEVTFLTATEF